VSSNEARDAGRGVFFIAGAKAYFMIAGAAITFVLPSIFDEAVFGAYLVIAGAASLVNNVMVTGTIQAVSRFTAQARDRTRAIQAAGYRMHLVMGLPIAVLFAVLSPWVAAFFQDSSKIESLRLAALIVGGYAFYAVFVGTANGMRAFHKQAGLDVIMATLRAAGIIGLAVLGFGVYGAIGGWVAATGAILVISTFVVGVPQRGATERYPIKPMLSFFASVAFYLLLLNLIMLQDTFLLKRLTGTMFLDAGLDANTAAILSDAQVGYYGGAQAIARLSYQAIIAATFVIFPLISRSTFQRESETTKLYISTTMRYSLMLAMAFAVVFVANPYEILDLPFKAEYPLNAAKALVALALGYVAFSLFAIVGTILNGAGRTTDAIISAAVTVVAAVVGNWLLIPRFDPGPDVLFACAAVTGGAMLLGAVVGGALMYRALGAFIPVLTVVRVILAAGVAIAVARVIPFHTPLMTLIEAGAVGVIYLIVLIASREITRADVRAVLNLRQRGGGGETP
jgi:stage V sporulation protein B